jgi:GT2 family glycosyltransferase
LSILLVFFFLGRDYACHRLTSHSLNNRLWTDDLESSVDLQGRSVAIVITVHGAIDYLRLCLDSIHRHSTGVHVYLCDDSPLSSDREKVLYISRIYSNTTYLTQPGVPVGYTKTVNLGLKMAFTAGFPTIIQLNSDTEVTPGWLPPIIATLNEDRTIGAVGTLSNAASWQSVPELKSKAGGWSTNELMPGWTPDMMAKLVRLVSRNKPIELPILNGFLIAYKKEVFSHVGYMDAAFPPWLWRRK